MGVKYAREYDDIVKDLIGAINEIEGFYEFLEMKPKEWEEIEAEEKEQCVRTLADDVFYSLGSDHTLKMSGGVFVYDKDNNIIKIFNGKNNVRIINLI